MRILWPLALGSALVLASCSSSDPSVQTPDGDQTSTGASVPTQADAPEGRFVTFESGQVRPLALSADGARLFATNTPNGTLDILTVTDEGLQAEYSVPVGMEPVAVALFGDEQAWVVNHLSDSISIVDLVVQPPRVIDTLLVGDEPRDIVFADSDNALAFITTAHRGQNGPDDTPIDAELFTPSVGRADVWVFDATATGDTLGGDPVAVLSMFGDTPGALAVSPDRSTVYAAVMHSGNQTTAIGENGIAKSGPVQSSDGAMQPDTGLIVQFDGTNWLDDTGANTDLNGVSYDSLVRFTLPDNDVFAISATRTPVVVDEFSGVGTTLFNMAINPVTGALYVSNTEANNLTRFEGEGTNSTTVRGNIVSNRITVIDDGNVKPRDLNKQLDRTLASATEEQRRLAMAQPLGMAVTADGSVLYVAGFGSEKIAVYDTDALNNDTFEVTDASQISLSGGGPTGLVLDEARSQLYVLTRFNNSIASIDTSSNTEIASTALVNPEPDHVIAGRQFLYSAGTNSSHGDASCASCHIFGDVDALAWDLGNPDASLVANPNRFVNLLLSPAQSAVFHPMKGPMTTQSFRGLANNGPMHWRGDRTGVNAREGQSLEHAAFTEFNVAFPELLGRDAPLSEGDMAAFADFVLEINYPPNPIRALDNSLTPSQAEGLRIYKQDDTTGAVFTCDDCHRLDPENGLFGTSGRSSIEGDDISQEFKVPHLRNAYQKVGKFGNSGRFFGSEDEFGEQIRGFGFMHDGNMDTLDNFFKGSVFRFHPDDSTNTLRRGQVVDFVMAMDSDLAPIVGQQVTVDANSGADTMERLDLLLERAAVTSPLSECDLIANGVVDNQYRGFLLNASGAFESNVGEEFYSVSEMKSLAAERDSGLTFTCVPPGSGTWMGPGRN
ncbi:MAG: YncE family protein [Granulosicoccus sp.]